MTCLFLPLSRLLLTSCLMLQKKYSTYKYFNTLVPNTALAFSFSQKKIPFFFHFPSPEDRFIFLSYNNTAGYARLAANLPLFFQADEQLPYLAGAVYTNGFANFAVRGGVTPAVYVALDVFQRFGFFTIHCWRGAPV